MNEAARVETASCGHRPSRRRVREIIVCRTRLYNTNDNVQTRIECGRSAAVAPSRFLEMRETR